MYTASCISTNTNSNNNFPHLSAKVMISVVSIFLQLYNGLMSLWYGKVVTLQNDLWTYDKLLAEWKHLQQTAELISPEESSLTSFPLSCSAAVLQDSSTLTAADGSIMALMCLLHKAVWQEI